MDFSQQPLERKQMLKVGFKTDRGRVREENQDACFILHSQNVFLLADGVGGGKSGSLASRLAVMDVANNLKKDPIFNYKDQASIESYFRKLVASANETVRLEAESDFSKLGMATTLTACAIVEDRAYFTQVGDSRGYILRDRQLIQITEDHSYVNELIKRGELTPEEAEFSLDRHKITRAIGAEPEVKADFYAEELQDGDLVLLCSDGLYDAVYEGEIIVMFDREKDMNKLAADLIRRANECGGHDNISVVCIYYLEGERHG